MKIEKELQELLIDIDRFENFVDPDGPNGEVNEEHFNKMNGNPIPGDQITVVWTDRDEHDFGYVFTLPQMDDADDLNLIVHIPNPDNSDGMGDAPPVWIHLYELVKLDRVKEVAVRDLN